MVSGDTSHYSPKFVPTFPAPADKFEALQEVLGDAGGQRDVVSGLLTRISTLQAAVATAEATRRKLHNELVSIRGNVRVHSLKFRMPVVLCHNAGLFCCCSAVNTEKRAVFEVSPVCGVLCPFQTNCFYLYYRSVCTVV